MKTAKIIKILDKNKPYVLCEIMIDNNKKRLIKIYKTKLKMYGLRPEQLINMEIGVFRRFYNDKEVYIPYLEEGGSLKNE